MDKEKSFSLFDHSGNPPKKPQKKIPPPIKKIQPPLSEEEKQQQRDKIFQDPELRASVERAEKMQKELRLKMQEIMDLGGFSERTIRDYLQEKGNFTADQWKVIQDHRDELERSMKISSDPTFKKYKKEKKIDEQSKERKGKTLGGRKRWIDMR